MERKVTEAGTIYFATIAYLMDGSLKGKDSITFSEDYNLYVLQTTQSFFYQDLRRELAIGHSIIYVYCIV
jgi:hypothetical protein